MLKFLLIILFVAIYIAVSYWLMAKEGFDTARECAQYFMQGADGDCEDFSHYVEKCRNRYGESWIRVFTVAYSIEIVLVIPIITACLAIEELLW